MSPKEKKDFFNKIDSKYKAKNEGFASDAQRKADELNGVRARTAKGHYVADDPSTPDVNEAYVGGKAPKKKATKKKPVAKKKATTKKK